MKKYGIPYMGSKAKILPFLCNIFPKADNFYDLFGGGFSVSHFMIENRGNDYKQFYYNEIRKGVPELIQDAIQGKYSYDNFKPDFITREMFNKNKDKCAYTKLIWSFGNNGRNYLFGKNIEKQKQSLHNAIVFNKFDEFAIRVLGIKKFRDGYKIKDRRLFCRQKVVARKGELEQLEQLERLQQLQQLQRLQQLQQLERLQQLELYNTDYRKVPIKPNSIIYCDPPYIGTADYGSSFDHKEFYEWAHNQSEPVFISEYKLNDDRFHCITKNKKRSLLSSDKNNKLIKEEKVFVNSAGLKRYTDYLKEVKNAKA